ncbi:hypothetical protein [Streptomyces virginiae]|uniref:hypothetical protein n=1 Tax=Streptomyces virginiae TaxID=1961 RepID=UPI002251A699|nr:hypothetical protein [Streptomyces virginiae]MCX5174429.1 hypothetical protein [Streptomyces virginiae]
MALVAGEYEFTCSECDGDGSLQVIGTEGELVWGKCDDCHGEGSVRVDEEEAAERIECGQTPLRTPPTRDLHSSPLKDELDQWFGFLCDRQAESTPPANIMIGYAYGYAEAMLLADREEPAREKLESMIRAAENFKDHPDFPGPR